MTYATFETSSSSGAPVELYEFTNGVTRMHYCSGDEDITYLNDIYVATPIKRNNFEETSEINRSGIKITVPRDNAVASLFRLYPPGTVVMCRIFRLHRFDTDVQAVVVWIGRVTACEWKGGEAILNSDPIYTAIKRNGLRRFYQKQCPHVLYGAACGALKSQYAVTGAIVSMTGNTIDVAAVSGYPASYFAGGFVEWFDKTSGVTDNRLILSASGATLTLAAAIIGAAPGDNVTINAGCDHTISTCHYKFNNDDNYGGFPGFPNDNPFNGSTIY